MNKKDRALILTEQDEVAAEANKTIKKKKFSALKISTKDFKFNRDEANKR